MKYDYNRDKEKYLDTIAAGEELEHILVSFDENYNIYVSNKRFNDFLDLDEKKTYNILDFIHPEDADRFKILVNDGEKHDGGEVVRVKVDKDYRSCLVVFNGYNINEKGCMNEIFEFIDIVQAVDFYDRSIDDIAKTRLILGLSDEVLFTYTKKNNEFTLFYFDEYRKVVEYKGDLDEWKQQVMDSVHD
ncbi:MAG: hypothetical protein SPM04_00135, partial [Lachnospira sp.]|nr:hypothetical protein [Lachnospira sp.]